MVPFKISKQNLDSLKKTKNYNEVFVPVKKAWSDKRINKQVEKAWIKYSNSVRSEDKNYYRFSTPLFSDNGQYAIITINQVGAGATYIFKKIDNKWTELFILNRWVS